MVRGERYPENFKGPRDIEKYESSLQPEVWIKSCTMAMKSLAPQVYLPLVTFG
jgi:hypothetical protein